MRLVAILLAFWLAMTGPAMLVAGEVGLLGMTIALTIVVVGAMISLRLTLLLQELGATSVVAALWGMLIRMLIVGGMALAIRVLQPNWLLSEFFGWLIGFYLLALWVETWFVVRSIPPVGRGSSQIPNTR